MVLVIVFIGGLILAIKARKYCDRNVESITSFVNDSYQRPR